MWGTNKWVFGSRLQKVQNSKWSRTIYPRETIERNVNTSCFHVHFGEFGFNQTIIRNIWFRHKIEIVVIFLFFLLLQRNFAAEASKKRNFNGQNTGATLLQPRAKKAKIDDAKTTDYTSNIVRTKKYGEYEFLEDDKGYVHVYTDGSCENNGRSNAVAGYGVYFGEGHTL